MRRSRTENTAIYGYQNKPDDNGIYHINNGTDGVYQSNNVTDGIYHIPDDFIDSNNYMNHNNILHTKLYGEQGKVCSEYLVQLLRFLFVSSRQFNSDHYLYEKFQLCKNI